MATDPASQPPTTGVANFVAHRKLVVCLFISTIMVVATLAIILRVANNPSSLVAVGVTGALGGFMSALRRYYNFDSTQSTSANIRIFGRSTFYVIVYSLIPPLIGLIAALVVYVIFAGELIKGPLFPVFDSIADPCDNNDSCTTHFQHFLNDWKPKDSIDYAKVFFWGFVAGFSERFVPDLIAKLTAQTDASKA